MTKAKHILEQKRTFWQGHINSWEKTSMTQAEYCRQNGLSSKTFGYWKRKNAKLNSLSFIPVPLTPPMDACTKISRAPLCIVIDNRYRIEVSDNFSPLTLQKLVHTLEQM